MTTNKDIKAKAGRYQIDITPDQIINGKGNDAKCCPVYLAISAMFPEFTIKVLRTSVQIFPSRGNKGLYGKLPPEAIEFGYNLDHDIPVAPISFELVLAV